MDIFSYFNNNKPKELEHTCQGKIINIKTFRTSTTLRIYFESIPDTVFYYDHNLPKSITIGKVVTIYYRESILCNHLHLWITSISLLDDSLNMYPSTLQRFHHKLQYDENFTIGCLHCDNKILIADSKTCTGKIYQPFFSDKTKCDKCNNVCYYDVGKPCSYRFATCKHCQNNRIYTQH